MPEFSGGADPGRADHEQNLGENKIEQSERLPERFAARFDILLGALEVSGHRMIGVDLSVRGPDFLLAAERCGIRGAGSFRRRKRCNHRIPT